MPHLKGPVPQAQAKEGPMPQLVKKRRSGWAVLAAGALVASLLAVGAGPAGAATDSADHEAATEACVGDALGDQMFTDVSDEHAFVDAINCIAYYGITNGTGDGSTFSPNDDVTRAQMAVFIARAAGVAGVDLNGAMGDEFDDVSDIWQEARDAINQLAENGMISSGGDFRPGDAITRAEMASFLVGLMAEVASNVTISNGQILLSSGDGTAAEADDYFGDARATLPRANDAEVSAIYELGITKGASAAAVQDDSAPPLDYDYNPSGTVNRGQMAAFITRALAHTQARPEGISAQLDDSEVVVSYRDANFAPVENVMIDLFRTDTGGVELAFAADGSCAEVDMVSNTGTYVCEIDGTDERTAGDGDARVPLGDVDDGGTTVWAWTGDLEDAVDGDTDLFRLDIEEAAAMAAQATRVRVSTEFSAAKAHLGSSVLYTVQLEDDNGNKVTRGAVGKKPAQVLVTLKTTAYVDLDNDATTPVTLNPQKESVVQPLLLTTDDEGMATFSVAGLPDLAPDVKADKYQVAIEIQPYPEGNAPAIANYYIGDSDEAAKPSLLQVVTVGTVIFSTEASSRDAADVNVTVTPGAEYITAKERGVNAQATVSVTDQYGDPVPNVWATLTSSDADVTISGGGDWNVGSDGAHTFRYKRESADAATETLTVSVNQVKDAATADYSGTATVQWAGTADAEVKDQKVRAFDTETDTVYAGAEGSVVVVSYDSNDRFDLDPAGDDEKRASSYAEFERSIAAGDNLSWTIVGTGSRAINSFTLAKQ